MFKCDAYQRCMARSVALLMAIALSALFGLAILNEALAGGEIGSTAYVHATHLILRKKARSTGSPITQINQNEPVTILDYKGSWVYVAYKKHKGYVKGEYLSFSSPVDDAPSAPTPPPPLASEGGGQMATQGASLRLGDRGDAVSELQRLLAQAGYTLGADGVFGSSTQEALIAFQKRSGLAADGRAGSRTMNELRSNAQATQAPEAATPTRAPDSALRLDDQGEAVRELQKLLASAGYNVSADGVFGAGTENAVRSFQSKTGLTADGLAGKQTLELLRNPSAGGSATKVELLGWWDGGSKALPVGAKATVVDVRSGIRFTVRRWGGVNHADVEPFTKEDTAAMKKAYGGAWSWDRRPIWVLVNGRAIAASMNGMPHMGYSNRSNNFPGHFCIHMKNSRLHVNNRVDPAHAAAVNEAYNKRAGFQ